MNALLAYESDRAYVFQDYVWKTDYYPWQPVTPPWPRTPLNAIIAGPVAGGLWGPGDPAPRSISERWFDVVCPKSERLVLNTKDIKPAVQWENGDVIFDHWKRILREAPERCIEVIPAPSEVDGFPQTFDLWLWGTTRVLTLWEKFSASPISRLLETSPLVNSAIDRNEYLFYPRGPRTKDPVTRNPYERMMAVHVRRGDYKDACVGLATWNSTYYSWNLLPALPDHFEPPPGGSWGYNTPENTEKYLEHCWPTPEALLQKIHTAREEYIAASSPGTVLDIMYILTNQAGDWLDELKRELQKDGYNTIVTSRDLVLDQDQIGVNMAIDMDISRRAAVFIGNGVSAVFLYVLMPGILICFSGPHSRVISYIDDWWMGKSLSAFDSGNCIDLTVVLDFYSDS